MEKTEIKVRYTKNILLEYCECLSCIDITDESDNQQITIYPDDLEKFIKDLTKLRNKIKVHNDKK